MKDKDVIYEQAKKIAKLEADFHAITIAYNKEQQMTKALVKRLEVYHPGASELKREYNRGRQDGWNAAKETKKSK
jgi:hypothetical protein